MTNKKKPILTVRDCGDGLGVEVYGTLTQIVSAWGAVTQSMIEGVEERSAFVGARRKTMHDMLDEVLNTYEEELKQENEKENDDSFEKFKDDFFKKMPETREKFEGGDLLTQVISDTILRGAYEALKETKKNDI